MLRSAHHHIHAHLWILNLLRVSQSLLSSMLKSHMFWWRHTLFVALSDMNLMERGGHLMDCLW